MMLFRRIPAVTKYAAIPLRFSPALRVLPAIRRRLSGNVALLIAAIIMTAANGPGIAQESGCGDSTGADCDSASVTSAPSPSQPDASVGNPINLITGNKYQRVHDYQAGNSYLGWMRHYNSRNADYNIGLGYGWTHDFAATLITRSATRLDIVQGNGRRLRFHRATHPEPTGAQGADAYRAETSGETPAFFAATPTDGYITRAENGDSIWTLPDHRQLRFRGPLLVRINFTGPAFLTLHYANTRNVKNHLSDASPQLSHIRDHHGREISLHYVPAHKDPANRDPATEILPQPLTEYAGDGLLKKARHLSHITLPDHSVIHFHYDQRGNLIRTTYPDGEQQQYEYDDAHHPHLMTAALVTKGPDRNGAASTPQRSVWQYDDAGRAIASAQIIQNADGSSEQVHQVQLSYDSIAPDSASAERIAGSTPPGSADANKAAHARRANVVTGLTTVTNSLNHVSRYHWRRYPDSGHAVLTRSQGPGCFTCPPTGVSYEYTDSLQVRSIVADTGRTDRFEYDALGRRTRHLATATTDAGTETLHDSSTSYRQLPPVDTAQARKANSPPSPNPPAGNSGHLVSATPDDTDSQRRTATHVITHRFPSINPNGQTLVRLQYNNDGQLLRRTRTGFSPALPRRQSPVGATGESNAAGIETAPHFAPISEQSHWHYDAAGRLEAIDPPGHGNSNLYTFDYEADPEGDKGASQGYPFSVSAVHLPYSGPLQLEAYSPHGFPQQLTEPDGTVWVLQFDRLGRLTDASSQTDARKRTFSSGLLVMTRDRDKRVTQNDYDAAGRLIRVTETTGESQTLAWNNESQLTELNHYGTNNEWLSTTSFAYTRDGKVSSSVKRQMNFSSNELVSNRLMFTHDHYGFVASTLQPRTGRKVHTRYSPNGALLSLRWPGHSKPDTATLNYKYDVHHQLVAITDPAGASTRWQRDDFGRVVIQHSPDTGRALFAYDEAGNVLSSTDNTGHTRRYAYDPANRVTRVEYNEGTVQFSYTHASTTNTSAVNTLTGHDAVQRLTEVFVPAADSSQPAYHSVHQYGMNGKPDETRLMTGSMNIRASYRYNNDGIMTGFTTAGDRKIELNFQMPAANHNQATNTGAPLTSLSQQTKPLKSTHVSQQRFSGLLDQPLLRIDDFDGPNNYTIHYSNRHYQARLSYPDGRLRATTTRDSQPTRYSYNNDFLIDGIASETVLRRYQYQLGKLVTSASLSGRNEYRYDDNGNRTLNTRADAQGSLQHVTVADYNNQVSPNRLTRIVTPDTDSLPLTYNANGSQTRLGELQFEYDSNQRLITVWDGDTRLADYAYLSNGHRLSKTTYVNQIPKTEFYFYQHGNLASIIDSNGYVSQEYLYKGDRPILLLTKNNTYSIQTDHLKRPIAAHDKTGTLAWQAEYTPYGQAIISRSDITLPIRAPGQFADSETGLHYNHHRYYNPTTGRYLSSDPLGIEAGINTYEYSDGNPINYYDPMGLYLVAFEGHSKDGTFLNNTNVSRISKTYYEGQYRYYKGDGTDGVLDKLDSLTLAQSSRSKIDKAIEDLIRHLVQSNDTNIDIIGYSRGGAQALEFVNSISELNTAGKLPKPITIRFLGLFDTVSTGLTKNSEFAADGSVCKIYNYTIPTSVQYAAQAIALSEHRTLFPVESIEPDPSAPHSNPTIIEAAFLGTHADIGGGTSDTQDLSDIALQWMLKQARIAGAPVKELMEEHSKIDTDKVEIMRTSKEDLGNRIIRYPNSLLTSTERPTLVESDHPRNFFNYRENTPFSTNKHHHQYETLSNFINSDGTIRMEDYLSWLSENYGISLTH